MGNTEPSLVPEWLRSSGSGTGSSGACHHFASSQSDGSPLALSKRNKPSESIGNSGLHSVLDWRSSSNSGRTSSSNGSAKNERNQYSRSYSSFSRNQRDRDRGRLKIEDNWDADYSNPLRSIMTGTTGKDTLRRSQSMASRKQSEVLKRRDYADLRRAPQNNHGKGNGLLSVGNKEKVAFERDFPLLRSEERSLASDIVRVPSPGMNSSMQGLSIGNSTLIGGEGWTSALAEVPAVVGGNTIASTANQPVVASSVSSASSATTGLNMAETLVQAPFRSHTAQQPSMENQKREELAVLQSMRLIPMTPSTPKNLVLNPSDKLKTKTSTRSGEQLPASKNGHQLASLQPGTQPARGANVKTDGTKASHTGKMLVLKPGRENGVLLSLKDTSNPTGNVTSKVVNGHHAKHPINPKLTAPILSPGSKDDKKSSLAQAQSRSDFFNLMRKKSMSTSAHAESSNVVSSVGEKSAELENGTNSPMSPFKNDDEVNCNGDACTVSRGLNETSENGFGHNAPVLQEEQETAFLRSLGWDENAGDDEGLTEEEINAFYEEYMKLKPASKLCRGLHLMSAQSELPAACNGGPSEFGSSDSSA